MNTRELTCIGCPLGCAITVTMDGSTVTAVTGNTCPRGDAYARKEVTNPTRIVTSTVRVNGGIYPMANVNSLRHSERQDFRLCQRLKGYHRQCTA